MAYFTKCRLNSPAESNINNLDLTKALPYPTNVFYCTRDDITI